MTLLAPFLPSAASCKVNMSLSHNHIPDKIVLYAWREAQGCPRSWAAPHMNLSLPPCMP